MAAFRDALLRMDAGIWFFVKRFGGGRSAARVGELGFWFWWRRRSVSAIFFFSLGGKKVSSFSFNYRSLRLDFDFNFINKFILFRFDSNY